MDVREVSKGSDVLIPLIARSLNVLHPATAFLYFVLTMTWVFMFSHPLFIGTALIFALLQGGYFVGFKMMFKRLKFIVLFCLLPAVLIPLINRRGTHIIFYLFDRPFTWEAVSYAVYTICLLLSMFAIFLSLNTVVSSSKLLHLFSGVAPQTAFITNMTLRFSAVLKVKSMEFAGVQQVRSGLVEKQSFISKIKQQGGLLAAFSLWTLEDGVAVSDTLRAKEYGKRRRTHYQSYIVTRRDVILCGLLTVMGVTLIFMKLFHTESYDYFRGLSEITLSSGMWICYGLLTAFLCIPFAFDAIQILRRRINA